MRGLASGKNVTTFTVASNEFLGGGKEKAEYHSVVALYGHLTDAMLGRAAERTDVILGKRPAAAG